MKISFVIPAYNEEAYIGACLTSIQKELERVRADVRPRRSNIEAEVVVVNNASTDNTRALAQGFVGVRVVDEPHKGLVRARKAGFDATSGELVANIDADTIMPEGWLTTVLAEFAKNNNLVALSGPYRYYDLSTWRRVQIQVFYVFTWALHAVNYYVLRAGAIVQGGNFVIRRDAWERAGGFDTSIEFYGEDTDVAKRLSKVGLVVWTWRLPMYTSGRRLAKEGTLRMAFTYGANYFWMTFVGRPFSKTYIDVRSERSGE
ncbi:MAG TPA: glycosyltransferase family 2 protein [Candidatus Paceibacterota bacterium]|nr:glycosyltransferase family 2 protein [Candidatus Paceibacterota bacterium]